MMNLKHTHTKTYTLYFYLCEDFLRYYPAVSPEPEPPYSGLETLPTENFQHSHARGVFKYARAAIKNFTVFFR